MPSGEAPLNKPPVGDQKAKPPVLPWDPLKALKSDEFDVPGFTSI